jgi:hypothetical protein
MCAIDDAGPWDFHDSQIFKAAKPHRCSECRRTIQPGEKYERVTGKIDGDFVTYKTCAHCIEARKWLEAECHGWLYTGVAEDLYEHTGSSFREPAKEIELLRLVVGIQRDWQRFDGTGLMPLPKVETKERRAA